MFTPSVRRWSSLFRSPQRAARTARDHALALARIESWVCPFRVAAAGGISVHLVTSSRDWRLGAWMLASWIHFTERPWTVVIHDDGTLTDATAASLQNLFPAARIIRRKEADAALEPVLLAFPFCETLRSDDPSALKLIDTLHFAPAERFFVFDSDVLFFNYPRELVDWAEGATSGCWFTEAAEEQSLVSPAEARDEVGVTVWPRVDTGISLWQKAALDLDFMDTALAQTSLLRGSLEHAAQTLAMLCAARFRQGGLLPRHYEVSRVRAAADEVIGRHYPGTARERFFEDGLKRVTPHLFIPDEPR